MIGVLSTLLLLGGSSACRNLGEGESTRPRFSPEVGLNPEGLAHPDRFAQNPEIRLHAIDAPLRDSNTLQPLPLRSLDFWDGDGFNRNWQVVNVVIPKSLARFLNLGVGQDVNVPMALVDLPNGGQALAPIGMLNPDNPTVSAKINNRSITLHAINDSVAREALFKTPVLTINQTDLAHNFRIKHNGQMIKVGPINPTLPDVKLEIFAEQRPLTQGGGGNNLLARVVDSNGHRLGGDMLELNFSILHKATRNQYHGVLRHAADSSFMGVHPGSAFNLLAAEDPGRVFGLTQSLFQGEQTQGHLTTPHSRYLIQPLAGFEDSKVAVYYFKVVDGRGYGEVRVAYRWGASNFVNGYAISPTASQLTGLNFAHWDNVSASILDHARRARNASQPHRLYALGNNALIQNASTNQLHNPPLSFTGQQPIVPAGRIDTRGAGVFVSLARQGVRPIIPAVDITAGIVPDLFRADKLRDASIVSSWQQAFELTVTDQLLSTLESFNITTWREAASDYVIKTDQITPNQPLVVPLEVNSVLSTHSGKLGKGSFAITYNPSLENYEENRQLSLGQSPFSVVVGNEANVAITDYGVPETDLDQLCLLPNQAALSINELSEDEEWVAKNTIFDALEQYERHNYQDSSTNPPYRYARLRSLNYMRGQGENVVYDEIITRLALFKKGGQYKLYAKSTKKQVSLAEMRNGGDVI